MSSRLLDCQLYRRIHTTLMARVYNHWTYIHVHGAKWIKKDFPKCLPVNFAKFSKPPILERLAP